MLLLNNFFKTKQFSFFTVLLSFTFGILEAQVNMVPNPSFEDTLKTPYNKVGNLFIKNWHNLDSLNNSFCPINYYSKFCTTSICLLPNNSFFSQNPRTGNAVIALQLFYDPGFSGPSLRSLARVRLHQNLISNKVYCAKMYVCLIETCKKSIDGLHMYFDNGILDTVTTGINNTGIYTFVNPQVKQPPSIVVNDSINWVEISGTFTATGNETYLTLGNFYSDASTTQVVSNPTVTANWSGYIIDDVSVIDFNLSAFAGPDKNITLGDSAFIGRPPEIGLECTWATGTTTIGAGGGLWVKPTTTGTFSYIVTQNICGNIKTDTVNVNISNGINENTAFAQSIGIYPQPAKDVVNISLSNYYAPTVEVKIIDVTGHLVSSVELAVRNRKAQLETSELSNGVYILQITNGKQQTVSKRLVIAK